jgi:hypothetical protein
MDHDLQALTTPVQTDSNMFGVLGSDGQMTTIQYVIIDTKNKFLKHLKDQRKQLEGISKEDLK